jgi:hypothetical protein
MPTNVSPIIKNGTINRKRESRRKVQGRGVANFMCYKETFYGAWATPCLR